MNPEVEAYIAALPPLRRERLEAARRTIHAAFDDIADAHRHMEANANVGKILIDL